MQKASTTFPKDYGILGIQLIGHNWRTAPRKPTLTEAVFEVSQQTLPASCHRECHFVTADAQQETLP